MDFSVVLVLCEMDRVILHGFRKGLCSEFTLPKGGAPLARLVSVASRGVGAKQQSASLATRVQGVVGSLRAASILPGPGGDPDISSDHRALGKRYGVTAKVLSLIQQA